MLDAQGGLHIDHELRQNGNYGGSNNYSPVSDPSNRESEPQAVVLHRFTGQSTLVVLHRSTGESALVVLHRFTGQSVLVVRHRFTGQSVPVSYTHLTLPTT